MERKILYRIDTFLEFSLDSTILVLDHRVTIYIEEKNAGWKYSFIRPGFFPPNSEQHLSESIFEFLIVGCWNNPFFFFSFFFHLQYSAFLFYVPFTLRLFTLFTHVAIFYSRLTGPASSWLPRSQWNFIETAAPTFSLKQLVPV